MFAPNLDCWITKQDAVSHNLYGEQEHVPPRIKERCALIRARASVEDTTVRADSSASRGHAEEVTSANRVMLTSKTKALVNDKIEIAGLPALRITMMHPRYDVVGRLDHYEVEGEAWV